MTERRDRASSFTRRTRSWTGGTDWTQETACRSRARAKHLTDSSVPCVPRVSSRSRKDRLPSFVADCHLRWESDACLRHCRKKQYRGIGDGAVSRAREAGAAHRTGLSHCLGCHAPFPPDDGHYLAQRKVFVRKGGSPSHRQPSPTHIQSHSLH